MADHKTIKTFTATDIEKYHAGKLSPREMHALEKAALDDPFLADALEGYAVPGVNVAADITELKKRLADKEEQNKVIPIASPKSSFPWLRAAALFILVAGAAFLVYQFSSSNEDTNDDTNIAQAPVPLPAKEKATSVQADSSKQNNAATTGKKADSQALSITTWQADKNAAASSPGTIELSSNLDDVKKLSRKKDTLTVNQGLSSAFDNTDRGRVVQAPQYRNDLYLKDTSLAKYKIENKEKAETFAFSKPATPYKYDSNMISGNIAARQKATDYETTRRFAATSNAKRLMENQLNTRLNVFRGKVTDANFNALPFANITNVVDNIGTYTDAKGNFILVSSDSVLTVQVRSIGFENSTVQLQNTASDNQVLMQEDNKSVAEVVISKKTVNSNRSRSDNMKLEEPEPVDGWTNYDTYLANNVIVPEPLQNRKTPSGEVELSFEVNRKGEPTNITVERSLCESCDKEAIRLIKEGPKWKRKGRKGRTSVTISF